MRQLLLLKVNLISCQNKDDGKLKITEDGKSDYEIVYKGKTDGAQYKSAKTPGKYTKRIRGAELRIIDGSSQSSDR